MNVSRFCLSLACLSTISVAAPGNVLGAECCLPTFGKHFASRVLPCESATASVACGSPSEVSCVPNGLGTPAMTFELNLMMTAEIQSLGEQVEALRSEAEEAAESREQLVQQLAAMQAERDQALAEKKELGESLRKAEAATIASEAIVKESAEALVKSTAENGELKEKLAAANAKVKKSNQQLTAARAAKEKSDSEKKKADEKIAELQANRTEESETAEQPEGSDVPEGSEAPVATEPAKDDQ